MFIIVQLERVRKSHQLGTPLLNAIPRHTNLHMTPCIFLPPVTGKGCPLQHVKCKAFSVPCIPTPSVLSGLLHYQLSLLPPYIFSFSPPPTTMCSQFFPLNVFSPLQLKNINLARASFNSNSLIPFKARLRGRVLHTCYTHFLTSVLNALQPGFCPQHSLTELYIGDVGNNPRDAKPSRHFSDLI